METGMLKIWNATNFRRTLGGLCLIVAPLLHFATEHLIGVGNNRTASDWLATATQHHDGLVEATYLDILSGILLIPAFFAILHVVRGRGVILAHIGVALALVGVVLWTFVQSGASLMVGVMGSPGLDSGAMTALIQKSLINASPASAPFFGLFLVELGYVLVGLAVWRSGFGYRWAGPLISISVVAVIFNPLGDLSDAVIDALLVVGLAAIGLRMLLMPDSAWDSAPGSADKPAARAVPHAEHVVGS
ncbi:MAG TPA: hypothetical protein VIJ30_09390 [Candidatus Dormibacteraeota bacterium]